MGVGAAGCGEVGRGAAGGLAAWAARWWAATGARGALLVGVAGLLGGCVDSDKVGGQDGEEGDDGAPDGGDGSDGGAGDDGGDDGADGSDGSDGSDGGEVDPPDRAGRATRACAWALSETPGEIQNTASWQGELLPATTACADCLYDFSVEWTIFAREGVGDCDGRPDSVVETYAVAPAEDGVGVVVLQLGDDGALSPLAPGNETTSSLRWSLGGVDLPMDSADGRILYSTFLDEVDVGFTD